jgi:hypothetical protein
MQVEADKDTANDDGAGSVQSEENSSNRDERSADGMSASQRNSNQSSSPDDFSGRGAAKSLGISEREQHIVNCSRLVFIVCLLVSAAVLGTVVFFFTSEDEKGDFEALVRSTTLTAYCITRERISHSCRIAVLTVVL